jgi:hypothetical protein
MTTGSNRYLLHGVTTRADNFAAATTTRLSSFAGAVLAAGSAVTAGTAYILSQVFNGASSPLRIEPHGAVPITASGNVGSNAMDGIALLHYPGAPGQNWVGGWYYYVDVPGNEPVWTPGRHARRLEFLRDYYDIYHT